jgi:hypothetical protein
MAASGLSKLHVLPPNLTVTSKYYQENIPCPFLHHDINKAGQTGLLTERKYQETC